MLVRLLGLVVLYAFCSARYSFPADANPNVADPNTKFFNGKNFSVNTGPSSSGVPGLGKSLFPNISMPLDTILPENLIMIPDTAICDVLLNSPEPISISQIPFFCLCSHCKATMGYKGDKGDMGTPGIDGSPGRRGLTGFTGRPGFTGATGVKGQKGDQGDKGEPGMIGFIGMKGQLGFKGEKGDSGDNGPSGHLGPQGEQGSCPCESFMGPPGVQGPQGQAGGRGLPGTAGIKGILGDKGDKGDVGLPGRDGMDGFKGERGLEGPCNCTNGKNGADGQKGQKGETGEKGDTGIKGVEGDTGLTGEYGDMGMMGGPGPCSLAVQSAFSVCLATPFPPHNAPVIFSKVIYNVQGHYNTRTGLYIAPVNGTYMFTFNLAIQDKPLIVGLFHNFYAIFRMTETTNLATVSQKVVLHLSARDMVWVQVKDMNSNGMYTDGDRSSTFSGVLLNPDTCDLMNFRDFPPMPNVTNAVFKW